MPKIMEASLDERKKKSPLEVEEIMCEIFSYLTAKQDLLNIRQVSKFWDRVSADQVGRRFRWKIGKIEDNPPAFTQEFEFSELMKSKFIGGDNSHHSNSIVQPQPANAQFFSSFHFCHNQLEPLPFNSGSKQMSRQREPIKSQNVLNFFARFGPTIRDLKVMARKINYVSTYVGSCSPNLLHLELYDLRPNLLQEHSLLEDVQFPNLLSLCVRPRHLVTCLGEVGGTRFHEQLSYQDSVFVVFWKRRTVCSNIIKNSPKLKALEITTPNAITLLAAAAAADLTKLTSLKFISSSSSSSSNSSSSGLVTNEGEVLFSSDSVKPILSSDDVESLGVRCPNLKIFHACIKANVKIEEIADMVAGFTSSIEELNLQRFQVLDGGRIYPTTHLSEKHGENGRPKIRLPNCPILKRLTLKFWPFHDKLLMDFPSLTTLDLCSIECGCELRAMFSQNAGNSPGGSVPGCEEEEVEAAARAGAADKDQLMLIHLGKLTQLKLSGTRLPADIVKSIVVSFARLTSLEIQIGGQVGEALRSIFRGLPLLTKLVLQKGSQDVIGDAELTGISQEKLIPLINEGNVDYKEIDQATTTLREFPFIGDLKYLRHFAYAGDEDMTSYSILFGFRALRELTHLIVPNIVQLHDPYSLIPDLAEQCPLLTTLNIGIGISELNRHFVANWKTRFPNLELVKEG